MKKPLALLLALVFALPVISLTTTSCQPSGYHSGRPGYHSGRPEYGAYGTTKKMRHARKRIVSGR